MIDTLATSLMKEFAMTNLGLITKYLSVNFVRQPCGLLLRQESYTLSIIDEFSFLECQPRFIPLNEGVQLWRKTMTPPVDSMLYKHLVGKLLYLSHTQPDIAFVTNGASKYMHLKNFTLQLSNASYGILRNTHHMTFSTSMGRTTILSYNPMPITRQTWTHASPLAPRYSP